MRTTVTIDDKLFEEAQDLTGIKNKAEVIREGIRALIERESARRLAKLGGHNAGPGIHPSQALRIDIGQDRQASAIRDWRYPTGLGVRPAPQE